MIYAQTVRFQHLLKTGCLCSVNNLDLLIFNAEYTAKPLSVLGGSNQHNSGKISGFAVDKTCGLFTGTDTGADGRGHRRGVIVEV